MNNVHLFQLAAYIQRITSDNRVNTSHLSIYMALLTCWQNQKYPAQFKISRKEVMRLSKIAAISTYHRCLKEMIQFGYFKYEPEYDSYKGSRVSFT